MKRRFPVSTDLAPRLFAAFWNECLFRLNACTRKGVPPESASYFVAAGAVGRGRVWLLRARYAMAACVNALLLFLQTQKRDAGGPVFLFTNLRHARFCPPGAEPVRVGLYNLRYLEHPHLLARLSPRDWLSALRLAFASYGAFRADCREHCRQLGEDWKTFRRLAYCGRLRNFDAILHSMALEKGGGEAAFAGHFDLYVAVASMLRERGALTRLIGFQHGLFEYPPEGRAYEPLFTDAYHLAFEASRPWVARNFLKNPDGTIEVQPTQGHIDFQPAPRTPEAKVVAFGAQEILPCDDLIVARLLALKARLPQPLEVLVYAHPLFACPEKWAQQGAQVFIRERHGDIDALVTRYSTLGLDYQRIGVPVVFVPFGDRVCVFESGDAIVCEDLDQMEAELRRILGD